MAKICLLIGGNQGDKHGVFCRTLSEISSRIGVIVSQSAIFETEAWGFSSENFWNQAVVVESSLDPFVVLERALQIEADLGRERHGDGYEARPMDIDIMFIDDRIIHQPELQVPHPRMQLRRFVLEPMAEVARDWYHPVLHKRIDELLNACRDQGEVKKLNILFH